MNGPFDVDPEITRARTLPARAYHDPDIWTAQRERVFGRAWHLVADAHRVRAPGHLLPFNFLEGSIDEPLLLSCDDDGRLHCLSNVCTHRGAIVVEGESHARSLRCRYHGRRFRLDGRFDFMPEFDGALDFPSAADDLPQVPLERWGPFLFASLDPAFPFDEWIEPVRRRVDWMPLDRFVLDPDSARDYHLRANWALYVDNYLEEFHIPYVHAASLGDKLDYAEYHTECFPYANLQFGMAKPGEPVFDLPEGHPDHGRPVGAFYFWLFPHIMLNFYTWGLSLNIVYPLGPDRTRIHFRSWILDPSRRNEGAGADLHRVEMEDEEIVESTQRGVRSRLYDRGRYSPRREVGTHHFHCLLDAAMADSGSAPARK